MITLSIFRRQVTIPPNLQAVAKASASRRRLQLQLQQQLDNCLGDYELLDTLELPEDLMRWCIWQFSEQLVYNPLEELSIWFNYTSGLFLSPGYPKLYYARSERFSVSPSKSAVASVGEGVAGFLAQRLYHCRKLARPNHDFPDLIMASDENDVLFLVEAKASTRSIEELNQVVNAELGRLLAYASACAELDRRPIRGLLVGTAILSEERCQSYATEIVI